MWTRAQIPLLRILIPFLIGIVIAGFSTSISNYWFAAGLIGVSAIIPAVLMKKNGHYFIWIAFLFLGISIMGKHDDRNLKDKISCNERARVGIITDKIEKDGKGLQFTIVLLPHKIQSKVFTDIPHSADYNIGDTIQFNSSLDKPLNSTTPWGFNYRRYLSNKNIYYSTYVDSSGIFKKNSLQTFSISRKAYEWKEIALYTLKNILPENANIALIKSVTFGDKTSLDFDLKNTMRTAGLMHIMAVSGFHIGIIYLFLLYLFFPLKRINALRSIVVIIGIWIFILICGNPASAVRAGIMLTVYEIGKQFYDRPNKYNVLGISAFLILLFDPFQLYQIGFQFSFLALTGIFLFYNKINEAIISFTNLPKFISSPISLSFAAQGMLAPLCLYYFGYVSYWFWIWSLIAIPLTIAIMVGSLISITTALLSFTALAKIISYAPTFGAEGLQWIGKIQNVIPVNGLVYHLPLYLMIGALLILTMIAINIHFRIKNRRTIAIALLVFFLSISIYNTLKERQQSVYVFTSFDGSHILIKNGATALVIGDKIGPRQKLAITAHLGISKWKYQKEVLFTDDLNLKMRVDSSLHNIARIINVDNSPTYSNYESSAPVLYSAPQWIKTRIQLPENGVNILEHTFTIENLEL